MSKELKNKIIAFVIGFISFMTICTLVFLATICTGCSSNRSRANAQTNETLISRVVRLQYDNDKQREIILAYNNLLHQVWLDKPTYVEECLTETDEFATLQEMFEGDWGDTFEFREEEDSIAYVNNWDNEDCCIRVIKHIVIPEPTKSRLKSIFGEDIE